MRDLVDALPDGVVVAARDGTILLANHAAHQLFGYEDGELVGRALEMLVPESARGGHAQHRADYDAHPRVRRMGHVLDLRALRKNGVEIGVDIALGACTYEGQPAVVATVREMTERSKLESHMRSMQKLEALGSLAGGVAHDFNNILSVILSYTTLLLEGTHRNDPARSDLQAIHDAGTRAADLTRQLLAFGRRQILKPEPCDLNDVVRGLERLLIRLVGENIEWKVVRAASLGTVNVDRGQIEQVIMNLVINARDAMPRGGKLTVETANVTLDEMYAVAHEGVTPGAYVVLMVTDTGVGMDAATKARMFEPFFTTKPRGEGTGLGLATVFGIVTQSGGHIWVYSEPGKGSTFKVYFPRTEVPAAATHVPPPIEVRGGTETILVVEDEAPVRTLVCSILRRRGYNVLEADNGGEALLIGEQHAAKIHLLLTDVVMPHISGRDLATRLLKMHPEMKVLYMSGYTNNSIVHHGVLDSDVAFLPKPITPNALLRKLRDTLDDE